MLLPRSLRACARFLVLLSLLTAVSGCGPSPIEPGTWRGVLSIPGGELPFGLELARHEDGEREKWLASLVNGANRLEITDVRVEGGRLEMSIPGYLNTVSARMRRDRLEGQVAFFDRGGEKREVPFVARHGASYRFFPDPYTDNADVSGRWSVTFTDAAGAKSPAIAELRQRFHEVTGTVLTTMGDYGYLAGEMRDDELYLSTYDGARAYLFRATLTPQDELRGTSWSSGGERQEFVARRDEAAELDDADQITRIRDDTWSLGFTYPDENGKAVSLADRRFRGKVVIVTMDGSWCPNSQDAAAFLAPLYRAERERGLEVVALMFEHFAQFEQAARSVKALRAAHDVEFATLIAGVSDKARVAASFPQLSQVHAFPTTLFLDRRGRVRRIHTGFDGPASGRHYDEMIETFTDTVNELLAEPVQQQEE